MEIVGPDVCQHVGSQVRSRVLLYALCSIFVRFGNQNTRGKYFQWLMLSHGYVKNFIHFKGNLFASQRVVRKLDILGRFRRLFHDSSYKGYAHLRVNNPVYSRPCINLFTA